MNSDCKNKKAENLVDLFCILNVLSFETDHASCVCAHMRVLGFTCVLKVSVICCPQAV